MNQPPWKSILIFLTLFIIISSNLFVFGNNNDHTNSDPVDVVSESLDDNNPTINTRVVINPQPINQRSSNEWRMHRFSPDHNGFTTASGPTNASILWFNTTAGSTYSSPCVANGRVFFGVGNTIKCYYENNGTLAWSMSPDQSVAGGFGVCSSPAYANGCIYFGADKIYCVWETNGTVRWKVNKPNIKHGDGSPTLAYGKVFIAGSDYKLYCIDQLTGIINWTFHAKSDYPPAIPDNWGLYAAPAVVNGSVYLAACDWYLYQINVTQPTSVATANNTFKMGWASYSSPVAVGDKVYVGCSYMEKRSESRFYCLWASNLTKIWEFYPNTPTGFFSSAGYYNGQLFIGSIDGTLYCLNATSGSQIWNFTLGGSALHDGTWSSPAITNERFYIGTKSGYIYCFNITQSATPEYYWRYQIGSEVDTSPSVVPGRVYIGTHGNGGRIYCFGTPDIIPPKVSSHYPENGSTNVPINVDINITFTELINPSTLTTSSFVVKDSVLNTVPGSITYNALTKTAVFNPDSSLKRGETYNITVTTDIQDYWTNPLDGNKNNLHDGSPVDDYYWNFTTSSNNPPTLTNPSVLPVHGEITTQFEFKVVYTDLDDDSPELNPGYVRVVLDDELTGRAMALNSTASLTLRDGKYDNGEEYVYSTTFSSYGMHQYRFVCSDGRDITETGDYNYPLITAKPVIDPIGVLEAFEDMDLTLNLTDQIHDEDSKLSELVITVNSSYAIIDEFNITFNYPNEFNYPSGRNYEIIALNVSDSVHNTTHDIRVNVHAVNDPPSLAEVQDIQIREDEYYYLDLTSHISDVDNEIDHIVVSENSNYATVSERNITFLYPNGSGILYEYVEINISDGELFSSQNILVTVIPESAQFVLLPIPEQNATEALDLIIDITDYIKLYGALKIEDLDLETNSKHCIISRTDFVFNYPNSFNYPSGRTFELVQVNASYVDQTESKTFRINIQAINDGPEIYALTTPTSESANTTVKFVAQYLDIDGSEEPLVLIIINESEYEMDLSSGDLHIKGAVFEIELTLPPGDYEYYYRADDREFRDNSINRTKSYNLKIYQDPEPDLDKDNDFIPDDWELEFGLDPNNKSDGTEDPDGDGYSNLAEFLGLDGVPGGNDSTDPLDVTDFPFQDQIDDDDDKDNEDIYNTNIILLVVSIIVICIVLLIASFLFLRYRMKNVAYEPEDGFVHYNESQTPEDEEVLEE